MKINKIFRSARLFGRSVLLVITIVTVGIPTMISQMKANVENSAHHYGAHTIESIETLGVKDPLIDKISLQKDYYNQYLSSQFSTVEIEETIYYLKDSMTGKFTIYVKNEETPGIDIYINMNKNKTTDVTVKVFLWHSGNFKDTFKYLNKEELEYIGDYFGIENAYTLLQDHYKNLKQSPNNENSYSADYKDDVYEIEIDEFKYDNQEVMEVCYTIKKTF